MASLCLLEEEGEERKTLESSKRILLLGAFGALNLMVLVHYDTNLLSILLFFFTVCISTLVPGLLFLNLLGLYRHTAYRFALGLALGICLNIILYIGLSIVNLKILLFVIYTILLLIYGLHKEYQYDYDLIKDLLKGIERKTFLLLLILASCTLALVVSFFYQVNPLPSQQSVFYYVDIPWHLGNIAEITHHWYPQDPRLASSPFHYHVFFYVYMASLTFLSKVSIPIIFFRLYMLFFFYLYLAAAYFSGSRWFNSRSCGIFHVFIAVFCGTGLLSSPYNLFLKNLFLSPTFFLASILFLFLLTEFRAFLQTGQKQQLMICLLLFFGVIGAKGSFYPVIFTALLASLGLALLNRQKIQALLTLTMSSFLLFLMVFLYIFQGMGSEGIHFLPFDIIIKTDLFTAYQAHWPISKQPWLLICFLPIYFLAFFSFRLFALTRSLYDLILQRYKLPIDQVFLISLVLISLLPGYLLSYRGGSQYYFLFVGYIALNLLTAGYLNRVFTERRKPIFLKTILILLLLLSLTDSVLMMNDYRVSLEKLNTIQKKPITPDLYVGLRYLQENSDAHAVIASYRVFLSANNSRFFYYSAFSERRMLVEGWDYMSEEKSLEATRRWEDMKILYHTRDARMAGKILEAHQVDYLIVDKHYNQKLRFETDGLLQKKFENRDIAIYARQ